MTGIDLNRAGTPLLEIVTEPDMRSAAEAVAYAKTLHALVTWLGICDGNMQEGSFRCDVNVSVRPVGQKEYGTRCEIKNLNSFRFMEEAINVEVRRQIELIEDGGRSCRQTRLYDPDRKENRTMRSKEDAQDYRYFPDPTLPPLVISADWIARVKAAMPELPARDAAALHRRFRSVRIRCVGLDAIESDGHLFRGGGRQRRQGAGESRRQLADGRVSSHPQPRRRRYRQCAGVRCAIGAVAATDCRRHDIQQDRQGSVRGDVGSQVGQIDNWPTTSSKPRD